MSNSIKLDLTADTSQAEKAILDLTKDVDKLQKKAAQTDIKGEGSGGGSRRRSSYTAKKQVEHDEYKKAVKADLSPLKSAFSSITSQLGGLSSGLTTAIDTIGGFSDILLQAAVAIQAYQNAAILKGKGNRPNLSRSASSLARGKLEKMADELDAMSFTIGSTAEAINVDLGALRGVTVKGTRLPGSGLIVRRRSGRLKEQSYPIERTRGT